MHGIFVGEIQALEGAGRTCWDFDTASAKGPESSDEVTVRALKLDMARQCWDEARHCGDLHQVGRSHGLGEMGEFAEQTMLYAAACNADPVLRLTGVNRALEGLAIDVFNTMKPVRTGAVRRSRSSTYCEDWMLADEVTHVKMGSDWLRTAHRRRSRSAGQNALEFQRTVDKLFSFGGFRR